MITPNELLEKLPELGARRLTDWRSKGLMPPLASRGRGKGRGKIYFWKEPDILVRAQCLHHAFDHGTTTEIALLSLVHGGFYVEPKKARRVWKKYLSKLERMSEKQVEPGESPRDAFWNRAVQLAPKISEQGEISKDVIESLTAETLLTIYARRGFRPSPEDLSDTTTAANQYLAAAMAKSRFSHVTPPPLDKRFIQRAFELFRQGLSVTATKELIKGTSIEQFDQAISATRLLIRAIETFIATQVKGHTSAGPILEIRLIFRAIIGPPITAFFLQLIGEGYERKVRESLRLAEAFISACEAHPGRDFGSGNPQLPQGLQEVTDGLISNFKEIWRDFSLFRPYHIA